MSAGKQLGLLTNHAQQTPKASQGGKYGTPQTYAADVLLKEAD
jgi:hypothetical protein